MEHANSDNSSAASTSPESRSIFNRILERIYPIIGVEFKGNRRQLFNNPMEFPFKIGDLSVVRVEKGEDLGRVVHLLERLPEDRPQPEYEVLRRATAKDIKTLDEYHAKEVSARETCKEKIAKHGLQMKLVDVEYQFDGRKLTFYFTADGRIDFRQLVKDLAATFRTRIELKQIGARDETRRFGGLGPCGRQLCCAAYIVEFCPITTQMAKDQNLPLNPSKISGCCGRLKCCLQNELDAYQEALKVLPQWETRIETRKGPAFVEKLDVFNRIVFLRYESGDQERIEASALESLLSPGFEPQETQTQDTGSAQTDSEVISDDEDSECTGVSGTLQSKPAHRQRLSGKRHQPRTEGKSEYHIHRKKKRPNQPKQGKNSSRRGSPPKG